MNRNLVIVRAGDASLHPGWLLADGDARQWDLHISYFGRHAEPFGHLPDGVSLSHDPGSKYHGLHACLSRYPHFLDNYQRIALPDDDLQAGEAGWNFIFETLEETNAMLGQASLDPLSFFMHEVTLQRPGLRYREVDFIEVMAPVFTADLLRQCLPYFLENQSSWGLDFLFAQEVRDRKGRMIIVDSASFLHTRRVGKGSQYKAGAPSPAQEQALTLSRHGLSAYQGRSLNGVARNGRRLSGAAADRGTLRARINRRIVDFLGLNMLSR